MDVQNRTKDVDDWQGGVSLPQRQNDTLRFGENGGKGGKPLPRKMYKKVQVKPVHDDGTFSAGIII